METKLERETLLMKESALTPEKEIEYRNAITALEKKTTVLEAKAADLTEENADLKRQNSLLRKTLYGQKSEKTTAVMSDGVQLNFFDEAESEADITVKNAEGAITVAEHKRKAKRTHEDMLSALPVEEVIHSVEDKTCPECGVEMDAVGKEFVRDELVYIPAKLFVRKHYVEVVKCPVCGSDETKDTALPDIGKAVFKKATAPAPLINHSFCSPELLAHIIFDKYCPRYCVPSVPLYRQEKEFKALGLELSRTTMANWVIYAANRWAIPVWKAMKSELMTGKVIHADETVVQVLNEPGKKSTTDSRMWVYASAVAKGHNNILFQYAPTRNGDNAVKFLGDYDGYLVCDGYDGYNKLKHATRCGCFAHVRRKFVEALPTEKELLPSSKAAIGVEWCNNLFMLEREYNGENEKGIQIRNPLSQEEKHKQRQERSKPVLDGFFAWLNTVHPSGGTKLAAAVQYAINEKKYLYHFFESPEIPIDNNRAENAIRPFVVGRKNWLFCDSVKGAEASAAIYSLAASATANGLNVEKYFLSLFLGDKPIMPW